MAKLFLIEQDVNQGWDRYDSAVVCAPDEETARRIHPDCTFLDTPEQWANQLNYNTWTDSPTNVKVTYLGEAAEHLKTGVICASFNAG